MESLPVELGRIDRHDAAVRLQHLGEPGRWRSELVAEAIRVRGDQVGECAVRDVPEMRLGQFAEHAAELVDPEWRVGWQLRWELAVEVRERVGDWRLLRRDVAFV